MRVSRRQFLAAAALPQFSTTLKVVNLFATATDRHGRAVTDLTRADFRLEEEGRRQEIRYFSAERDAPLTVGLLIDTSGSTSLVQPAERDAARRFFQQVMRLPRDRGFVAQFDGRVAVLQDLTDEVAALDRATRRAGGRYGRDIHPANGRSGHGGTVLHDAVAAVSSEIFGPQPGVKAAVVLSDGVDIGSGCTFLEAVEAAQRADLILYTILFESPLRIPVLFPFPAPRRRFSGHGRYVLQALSEPTGGRYFEVTKKLSPESIFRQIEDDLRHRYSLGYTPDPPDEAGFRRIRLTTGRRNVRLRTRTGYYTP